MTNQGAIDVSIFDVRPSGDGYRGNCPLCDGKDTLTLRPGKTLPFIPKCFRCGEFEKLVELVKGGNLAEQVQALPKVSKKEAEQEAEKRRRHIERVWRDGMPISQDDPAWLYLTVSRKLKIPKLISALRYHPQCYYDVDTFVPTMLAAITDVDGKLLNVHRTFLQKEESGHCFGKLDRRLMKSPTQAVTAGGAIQLMPIVDGTLGIAEGIETAFAAAELFNVPVWSTVNAGGIERVKLPPAAKKVLIFADNDRGRDDGRGNTGIKAAFVSRDRLRSEGRAVEIFLPETEGYDFADELVAKKRGVAL